MINITNLPYLQMPNILKQNTICKKNALFVNYARCKKMDNSKVNLMVVGKTQY